ncbi:hypothetical protein FJ492_17855 [Mesorhizobium sp. B2-5-4]|uniref:hypothetical protein n=1 Tax=unclassified Mesorhizobium TaxID=325217 RepID=UPI00112AAD74|nr:MULTISPECIES: hypothetical protein [unclassified Mesorhizobium]TPJ38814.1 hypothetical protein FJ432_20875 [Mesorhizobium sp. B2-6-5]TPJ79507.1 hypothetical protein FJ434_23200 [Mesorhizobium sp. B2-5-13]TPK42185.1 hypothetical protein FJ492_17855 [Mesorhizobium sp. B2-5-4]TPK46326.1 hypothetical protein FJ560_19665 [Mesorhizobium sp. B2-5-5]TPL97211.1 hypothetical protein FJ960_24840 [Mesorhizobium sp. B2-3-11]
MTFTSVVVIFERSRRPWIDSERMGLERVPVGSTKAPGGASRGQLGIASKSVEAETAHFGLKLMTVRRIHEHD